MLVPVNRDPSRAPARSPRTRERDEFAALVGECLAAEMDAEDGNRFTVDWHMDDPDPDDRREQGRRFRAEAEMDIARDLTAGLNPHQGWVQLVRDLRTALDPDVDVDVVVGANGANRDGETRPRASVTVRVEASAPARRQLTINPDYQKEV